MPHGFLSYNIPIWGMREESMLGIKLGSEWILELFEIAETKIKEKETKLLYQSQGGRGSKLNSLFKSGHDSNFREE